MNPLSKLVKNNPLLAFFTLAFLFTWSNWIPQALHVRGITDFKVPGFMTIIAGYGPAISAIMITVFVSGNVGINKLFRRLVQWRTGIKWYAVVLLLPPAIVLSGLVLQNVLGYGLG